MAPQTDLFSSLIEKNLAQLSLTITSVPKISEVEVTPEQAQAEEPASKQAAQSEYDLNSSREQVRVAPNGNPTATTTSRLQTLDQEEKIHAEKVAEEPAAFNAARGKPKKGKKNA